MEFQNNDGGRAKEGYNNSSKDCVVRAIAIALEMPYKTVNKELTQLNKLKKQKYTQARYGNTPMKTIKEYLDVRGWEWVACSGIGKGCTVHMKKDELPSGRIICRVSKHVATVIDGVVHDVYDSSRNGTRCVYGYFIKKERR